MSIKLKEEDYLRTLKKKILIIFQFHLNILKKIMVMEIVVQWDNDCCGYRITHSCPDMHKIDASEGNGA